MNANLPNDSDGDALRRLISNGSNLSKEMEIDFAVSVPDQTSGTAFAAVVRPLGYRTNVDQDENTGKWTCYCSRSMVPLYNSIIEIQQTLERLGRPYNAKPDGWGSFGNESSNSSETTKL